MKAGELQRTNSLFCFSASHAILMVHTKSVFSHIARLFSPFIEDRTTIYSKFFKKCIPKLCRLSTAQFMTAVHVEEPKEAAFSRCP